MFTPTYDKIVVRNFKATQKTSNGIYLPGEDTSMISKGKVVKTGPGRLRSDGKFDELCCTEGDYILYNTHSGRDLKVDDKEYHIMADVEVLVVLDEKSEEVKKAKKIEEEEAEEAEES